MIEGKLLTFDEIGAIWRVDRSETIDAIYYMVDGKLVLCAEHYDMHGWPPGEAEKYTPLLEECHRHGGWFYGLFEGGDPVGIVVLENRFIGRDRDQLQLKYLHVSHRYRDRGIGRQLFDLAATEACKRGARSLYISATPSEHTVDFYLRLGCLLAPEPDHDLFALEPEDIHLVFDLAASGK